MKLRETPNLSVQIMNSKRQVKGEFGHVVPLDVNVMLNLLSRYTVASYLTQIDFVVCRERN